MEYIKKEVSLPKEVYELLGAVKQIIKGAAEAARDDGKIDFSEGAALLPSLYDAAVEVDGVLAEAKADPKAVAMAFVYWADEVFEEVWGSDEPS